MFLGPDDDRTIFQILTRRGIDISPFSAVPLAGCAARGARMPARGVRTRRGIPQVEGEVELLLPAGIALKITGVLPKDASGLTIITCEDDDDAPALIL